MMPAAESDVAQIENTKTQVIDVVNQPLEVITESKDSKEEIEQLDTETDCTVDEIGDSLSSCRASIERMKELRQSLNQERQKLKELQEKNKSELENLKELQQQISDFKKENEESKAAIENILGKLVDLSSGNDEEEEEKKEEEKKEEEKKRRRKKRRRKCRRTRIKVFILFYFQKHSSVTLSLFFFNLPVILLLVRLVPKIQIRDEKSIVIFLCKYEKNQLKIKRENHYLISFLF